MKRMNLKKLLSEKNVFLDLSGKTKQGVIEALAQSGKFDYVFSGHTHAVVNEKKENGVIVLNPGEACGYLTGNGTFAIIDTKSDKAEIIYL